MAEIVLVHGIGQEQRSADSLESEWLPALAGGVRTAGADRCADELWRHARPGQRDVRMAFYGDLFRVDGRQGGLADELTEAQWALAEPLATQWLARSAQRASRASDRATAERELAALEPTGEVQGIAAALRPVLRSVARSRPFARLGVGLAERFVLKALRQVSLYFTDEDLRAEAQRRVLRHVDADTKVIIGHSLGSVVAYEVAHRLERSLPLLLTLGSPLGLDTVVYQRLRPQPPRVPGCLLRWVNIADRDDVVAAEPDLTAGFPGAAGVLHSQYTVDNGAKPHEATFYLTAECTGHAVARVLASGVRGG